MMKTLSGCRVNEDLWDCVHILLNIFFSPEKQFQIRLQIFRLKK